MNVIYAEGHRYKFAAFGLGICARLRVCGNGMEYIGDIVGIVYWVSVSEYLFWKTEFIGTIKEFSYK